MQPPFETLATCSLRVFFLGVITSTRRVGEITALGADHPFIKFHIQKVVLRSSVCFLPKMVSRFQLSLDISWPIFFLHLLAAAEGWLHTLDVKYALLFYLKRTSDFRKVPQLFVCYAGCSRGKADSVQMVSRWTVCTIKRTYELALVQCPLKMQAHSTGELKKHPLPFNEADICRAATGSSADTFLKHCSVDINTRETSVWTAVLH